MSITSRLFGKPWEHRDAHTRAAAVAESDDPELSRALPDLAEHDPSAEVRLAALRRIDTEPFWLDARLRENDPAIVEAADAFLVKAVMRAPDERLAGERLEWFRRIDDSELIRQAARRAPDRALRAEALSRITAPGFLGDCVVSEADEQLALSLLDRIEQISTLERIAATLRKHNKRRARAVVERLEALRTASGEHDPASASATRLVERAEALARGHFDGDRRGELDALAAEWRKLEAPPQALARRFNGALDIVRRSLEVAERPATPADDDGEAEPEHPDAALDELVARLEALDSVSGLTPEQAAERLGEFDRAWSRIAQPNAADTALRERAMPVLQALQKRRGQAASPEPESAPPEPEDDTDWQAELDAVAGLLADGEIARAQSSLRSLRSRHDRLRPGRRPRAVAGRLGRLEGRLREMRDWENWSNNKIRDDLIERIEALAESDQHPDAITAALKEARAEWQRLEDLEVLPGDKRRHAAPSGQWRRFQAACKRAFERAQPFFEKRHEVQAENLEQLDAFIERARQAADDGDSDIDTLKQFMRAARLAIRRLDDLPPKTRGRSAARLRELMDALSSRLDEAFESIENDKRRLVREAEALAHASDLDSAIEQAKALQARWQRAGTGRRRIEQELWKAFRAPIDPLFEQLEGERSQQREQQAAEQAALERTVEEAESLAEAQADALDNAAGRMQSLRRQWQAAGRKPNALNERFEAAGRKLSQRLDERRRAERRRAIEQLDALAEGIQAAWRDRQQQTETAVALPPTDDLDDDREPARTLLALAREMNDRTVDDDSLAARVESNGEAARRVVIEMEFLAGIDSPPEDREARMNFQVERLAQRMSERGEQPGIDEELQALRERWYRSFPRPVDEHAAMAKRFSKCQNVLESMSGQ